MNDHTPSVKRQHPSSPPMMTLSMCLITLLLLSAAPQLAVAGTAIGEVSLSSSLSSHSRLFAPSCSFGGSPLSDGNHGFRSFLKSPSLSLMTSSSGKKKSSALLASAVAASASVLPVLSYSYLARQKQRLVQSLQLQRQQAQLQLYKPKTLEQQRSIIATGTGAAVAQRKQQQRQEPTDVSARGGGGGSTASAAMALVFWENMVCGAASRSVAQTIMHPANCLKTLLQTSSRSSTTAATRMTAASLLKQPAASLQRLTQGAGASLLLSLPTGALNFAVLEYVRQGLGELVASTPYLSSQLNGDSSGQQKQKIGPLLDFASSALSTIVCSLAATPQTMLCDNIMAGNYPNLPSAVSGLARRGGIRAFYQGWIPGLAGKIPAYALTWTLFQRFKDIRQHWTSSSHHPRPATNFENSVMACLASSASVCIMIPMDCIKTRLVTQAAGDAAAYKGILDCAIRVAREEGIGTFYRGLPPRLVSVVPMMAIQFAVYEAMKRSMLQRKSLQQQQQQLY